MSRARKTPGHADFLAADVALHDAIERAVERERECRALDLPELVDQWAANAAELGRVRAWLQPLRQTALERAHRRCPRGMHRALDRLRTALADGLVIERCRCGASRVRDPHCGEVSDWTLALPSPPDADAAR